MQAVSSMEPHDVIQYDEASVESASCLGSSALIVTSFHIFLQLAESSPGRKIWENEKSYCYAHAEAAEHGSFINFSDQVCYPGNKLSSKFKV